MKGLTLTLAKYSYASVYIVAKVVCVQLTNMLGYDVIFQDVDVVWYHNPLDYFHNKTNPFYHFNLYFQDDGAHSDRYAPTRANSGFYYVRNNDKTNYRDKPSKIPCKGSDPIDAAQRSFW